MTYDERYDEYLKIAEAALTKACNNYFKDGSEISEAARYSLFAGGKRIRAILCLSVCEMLAGDLDTAAQYSAAIEMLQCYTLIHDDMPCVDNDDYRRGKLSCHKKYSESTALFAGDALLTAAFEVLADVNTDAEHNIKAIKTLSEATGARGLLLGQELDLYYERHSANENSLYDIHREKTVKFINAAVQLGAIAADAFDDDKTALERYAYSIGLVFQIVDDVLDVTSTQDEIGKPVGSDKESGKTTFVTLLGVDDSMALAKKLTNDACNALKNNFGDKSEFLCELAKRLLARKK